MHRVANRNSMRKPTNEIKFGGGRMGTSFFDQTSLSVPSTRSMSSSNDSFHFDSDDPFDSFVKSSFEKERPKERRKKRSSKKPEQSPRQKNLEQFLVESQVEDFFFQQNTIDKQKQDDDLNEAFRDALDSTEVSSLFDRDALTAATKSTNKKSRRKKKRSSRIKSSHSQHQQEPTPKQQQQQQQQEVEESPIRTDVAKVFRSSLANIFDGHGSLDSFASFASEGSLSLSELRSSNHSAAANPNRRRRSGKRTPRSSMGSRASQGSRSRSSTPTGSRASQGARSKSSTPTRLNGSATRLRIGIRPRSSVGSNGSVGNKGNNNSLTKGLGHLDRQGRRDQMKKGYRSGGSVSGMSAKSNGTRRSYKSTGFEGGALNAIMGNESFARVATRGGDIASLSGSTVASAPATEEFLKERRAKQDRILDTALKEKWLREQSRKVEVKLEDHSVSSHDELARKGLVKKMKKAVRRTKSGAKKAAHAVVDPKRTTKKGYKVAPDDEESLQPSDFDEKQKEKRVRSKKHAKKKSTSNTTAESIRSPLSKKPKKAKARTSLSRTSRSEDKRGSNKFNDSSRLHDSMSEMFPDFSLTEQSKVIWWDI